jgi:muconate cycloisomerase
VRDAHGDTVAIRADANAGFSRADAARFARAVADLDLQYFEQPLAPHDLDGLAALRERGLVPIAVDESLFSLADAVEIARRAAADVFIVKLIKLGGLLGARMVAAIAEAAGIRCTAVSPYESALGSAANVHLAAALPPFTLASELGVGISQVTLPGGTDLPCVRGSIEVPMAGGVGIDLEDGFFDAP